MKGRRLLAMLCAIMIFVMNFSGIPALAAFAEAEQTPPATEARAAEADKAGEEAQKAEEEAQKAEEAKKAEEEAQKAEEAKKAEAEARKAEEAKKAEEEARKAEEAKKAEEEARKAEEAKKAEEEAQKAEEAKKAEEEAKKAEEEAAKDGGEKPAEPKTEPTEAPAEEQPKAEPTEAPAEEQPKAEPTEAPAEEQPEAEPTEAPAEEQPEAEPTEAPAEEQPTEAPTEAPEAEPTEAPAEEQPEAEPTEAPVEEQPTEAPTAEPTEEPKEPLTLTNLSASASEVFQGEAVHFTFDATGAERVDYVVYNGDKRVGGDAVEGTSFTWTPEADGYYTIAVIAAQGGDSVMASVAVNVRPDYSKVKVTFTAKDEDGKTIDGYKERDFDRDDWKLYEKAPVDIDGYVYTGATLKVEKVEKKIIRLRYEAADRVWIYTEEYVEDDEVKYADTPVTGDADFVLSFEKQTVDARVTFTAVDAEDNVIGGFENVKLKKGDYALAEAAPVAVEGYIYQGATLDGAPVTRVWYADDAWNATVESGDIAITGEAALRLTFARDLSAVVVTFTAIDAEGNGVGGLVDAVLGKGDYDLSADGPVPVNSEKSYKYVNTTLNDAVVTALSYSEEAMAWIATVDGEAVTLTADTALTVRYEEQFENWVYRYSDGNIFATVTLSDAKFVPDDAKLVVTPITGGGSYDAYMAALNGSTAQEYTGDNTLLYDFAFMVRELDPETGAPTGKTVEYRPEPNSMRVSVTFRRNQISDGLSAEAPADVAVHHMPLKDSVLEDVDATVKASVSVSDIQAVETMSPTVRLSGSTDSVTFHTDSFSVFAFTVDFHYGVDYSIPGMSQILLSELIEKLNIMSGDALLDVKDVAKVEFSDDNLVSVEEVSGLITYNGVENVDVGEKDFLLTSQAPFTTDESLTITLVDGTVIVVGVTDDQVDYSNDLANFVKSVSINADKDGEGKYIIKDGKNYSASIVFQENPDGLQFHEDGVLTYTLPAGFEALQPMSDTFTIIAKEKGETYSIEGNKFKIENGVLTVELNTAHPDFEHVSNSSNTALTLNIAGTFNSSYEQIDWKHGVTTDIKIDKDAGVSVDKSVASFDKDTGKITYQLKIKSQNDENKNIVVTDGFDQYAAAIAMDKNVSLSGATMSDAGVSYNTRDNGEAYGFTFTIPHMDKDQEATVTYTATLNMAKFKEAGYNVEYQTKNNVSVVPGDPGHKPDYGSTDLTHEISKPWIGKNAELLGDVKEGKQTVKWTVTATSAKVLTLAGKTITDAIKDDGSRDIMSYSGDGLHIVVSGDDNREDYVAWSDVGVTDPATNKTWTYNVPEGDANKDLTYTITYTTVVDVTKLSSVFNVKNDVKDDYGDGHAGQDVEPGPEATAKITKTHTAIGTGANSKTVTWQINIEVPTNGLSKAELVDILPAAGGHFDTLKGTVTDINVTGIDSDNEQFTRAYTAPAGDKAGEVKIVFKKKDAQGQWVPGLLGGTAPRTITVTLTTNVDPDWYEAGKDGGWLAVHKNEAKFYPGFGVITDTDEVTLVDTSAKKTFERSWMDNGLPVYSYYITYTGVTGPFTVTDTFDERLELVADSVKLYGGDQYNQGYQGDNPVVSVNTDTAGKAIFNISNANLAKKDDAYYSHYKLVYWLRVKNQTALGSMSADAAREEGGVLTLTNTAVTPGFPSTNADAKYEVKVLDKQLINQGELGGENNVGHFKLTINPDGLDLDPNSDTITLTDVYSDTLSVDYRTIVATPSTGVSWNVTATSGTNTATFTLPDETPIEITYDARIIGTGNIHFENEATLRGQKAKVEDTKNVTASMGGVADNYNIVLLKYKEGELSTPLAGAVFELYVKDGDVPVKDKDGKIVTVETDDEGLAYVVGSQNKDGWSLTTNKAYYLKEIVAPEGYELSDTKWTFTIADDNIAQYDKWIYHNGDTVKVDNKPKPGLEIRKTVLGLELDDSQKAAITFTVTGPGDFSATKRLSEFTNGVWKLTDLAAGNYTVTESNADIDGYVRTTSYSVDNRGTTSDETATVSYDDATEKTVTFINRYKSSVVVEPEKLQLKVQKKWFVGDDASEQDVTDDAAYRDREVTVVLQREKAQMPTMTLHFSGSDGKALEGVDDVVVPSGANVTVSYANEGSAYVYAEDGHKASEGGHIAVTYWGKSVNYDASSAKPANIYIVFGGNQGKIEVTYTGGEEPTGWQEDRAYNQADDVPTRELTGGASKTFFNLPLTELVEGQTYAYRYYIKEVEAGEGFTTQYSTDGTNWADAKSAVVRNTAGTITVKNKKSATSVSVTKAWKNADGTTAAPSGASVTFELYKLEGTTETAVVDESSTPVTITLDGAVDAYGETAAWVATFADLPVLTEGQYIVKEQAPGWTNYTVSYADSEGKAMNYAVDGGTVTNTEKHGALLLTKTIAGYTGTDTPNVTFTVAAPTGVTLDKDTFTLAEDFQLKEGSTTEYELKDAAKAILSHLPLGQYKVTETVEDPKGYIHTATYKVNSAADATEYTGPIEVTIEDGQTATVAVTNTYANQTGKLKVTKKLLGNDLPATSDTFTFKVTLTGPADLVALAKGNTYSEVEFTESEGIVSGTFTITGEGSKTIEGLPAGLNYTVEESGVQVESGVVPLADKGYVVDKASDSGMISSAKAQEHTFTNTRDTFAKLKIEKEIQGNAAKDSDEFTFAIHLEDKDGKAVSGTKTATGTGNCKLTEVIFDSDGNSTTTIKLKAGDTLTVEGLPNGGKYTVTETNSGTGYTTQYTQAVGDAAYPDATDGKSAACENVEGNKAYKVKFINTKNTYGSIKLQKKVTGTAANDGRTFKVVLTLDDTTINGTSSANGAFGEDSSGNNITFNAGEAVIDIVGGQTVSVNNLPNGVGYTVTEQGGYNPTIVIYQKGSEDRAPSWPEKVDASKTGEDIPTIIVNNVVNEYGGLSVDKVVENPNGEDNTRRFTFTVTIYPNGVTGQTVTYKNSSDQDVVFTQDATNATAYSATFDLAANDALWTVVGIPVGTRYSVVETHQYEGFLDPSYVNDQGTIAAGDPIAAANAVVVTNTRKLGSLMVTKRLTGNMATLDSEKDKAFPITIDFGTTTVNDGYYTITGGTRTAFTGTKLENIIQLKNGQSVTIEGVPVGTAYTVTEPLTGDTYTGYATPVIEPATGTGTITSATEPQTVTVTNTIDGYGGLKIVKMTEGSDKDKKGWFAVKIVLSDAFTGDIDAEDSRGQFKLHFTDGVLDMTNAQNVAWYWNNSKPDPKVPADANHLIAILSTTAKDKTTKQPLNTAGYGLLLRGIPAGLTYNVIEDDYKETYDSQSVAFQDSDKTVDAIVNSADDISTITADMIAAKADVVKITNRRDKTGKLSIRKIITGNDTSETHEFTFTITLKNGPEENAEPVTGTFSGVTFNENGRATVTLTGKGFKDGMSDRTKWDAVHPGDVGGMQLLIEGLPLGTYVTVTETTDDQHKTANGYELTYSGLLRKDINGNKVVDSSTLGTVTDTIDSNQTTAMFVNHRDTFGRLEISKTLAADAPDADRTTKRFDFTIKLTDKDGKALTGDYQVSTNVTDAEYTDAGIDKATFDGAEQPAVTFNESGEATVHLKHGEKLTFVKLPNGASYVVTEAAAEGYRPEITATGTVDAAAATATGSIRGTIAGNQTESAAYTNTYGLTAIDGVKTWKGEGEHPTSITVELWRRVGNSASASWVETRTFTKGENDTDTEWTFSFGNLPKTTEDNKTITYELREQPIPGYSTAITKDKDGKFHIVNKKIVEPDLVKKIKDTNDSVSNSTTGWQDSADYDIGDDVPFQLKAHLANNVTDYKTYRITFNDVMEDGLDFTGIDSVKLNGSNLPGTVGYSLNSKDHGFDLTLTWGNGKNLIADEKLNGAEVIVEFTAKLNKDAKIGKDGNVNKAKLIYSNNPQSDETDETDEDSVICFTYKLVVNKVTGTEPLLGAEFKLEKVLASGGKKVVAKDAASTASTFTFTGLDDGKYILTETKAPARYKLMNPNPIEFTVTADHKVVWEDEARDVILETLSTGNVTTGAIELPAVKDTGIITATVEDKEAEKPDLTKKVMDTNDSKSNSTTEWQDSADYDIGDDVPFRLVAHLADNVTDYTKYHITFHDTMEQGLTYKAINSVKVAGNELNETDYELTPREDGFDLTITWEGENINAALKRAEVEVLFTATLNKDAVIGSQGNVNKAYLEYSNTPGVDDKGQPIDETGKTPEDAVIVFTYQVVVNKTDGQDKLPGAEFTLVKKLADGSDKTIGVVKGGEGTQFTFKGLDDGDYVLTETQTPEGYLPIQPIPFTVSADHSISWDGVEATRGNVLNELTGDAPSGMLTLTNEGGKLTGNVNNGTKPKLEKKIMDANDSAPVTEEWQDSADHDIGDHVPFKLTATLASNVTDYYQYHITFHDTMEKGLTFDRDSLKVRVNDKETEAYTTANVSDQAFDLTLTWGDGTAKIADTALNKGKVEVFFTATLNDKAKIGSEGNTNSAKLSYSSNPALDKDHKPSKDEGETPEDTVIVFTYEVDISKVTQKGEPKPGAEFKLEKLDKDGKVIAEKTWTPKVDGNKFTFKGLDDGTYVLTETKAPEGYLPAAPITFTVTANHNIEWNGEAATRETVLTGLTGEVVTGKIAMEALTANAEKGSMTGSVKNAEEPTFEKKVIDYNESTGVPSGEQDSADYDIGDDVPFVLSATLADNVSDYKTYFVTFSDVMDESLDFDAKSVVVKVNDKEKSFTFEKNEAHAFDLKVEWSGEEITKALNKAEVVVEFNAKLNDKAKIGSAGNINTGKLIYSSTPEVDEQGEPVQPPKETPEDTVIVFTYKVEIDKVTQQGEPKDGAEFKLEKLDEITMKPIEGKTWTPSITGNKFSFVGLDDGIYCLTETKAPEGFLPAAPITFTVTAKHDPVWEGGASALTELTGDVTTGKIALIGQKLTGDATTGALTGSVKNAEEPTFEKKVIDINDSDGKGESSPQDSADYDIGDDVPFVLTAKLADNVTDYEEYSITFHDTLQAGKFGETKDFKATVNGDDVTDSLTDGTKKSGESFAKKLTWGKEAIDEGLNGATVVLTFKAELLATANFGAQGNTNTAKLSYTNINGYDDDGKPTTEEKDTPEDSVIVFTYKLEISKVGEDGKTPKTGAEFKLEKVYANGKLEEIKRLTVTEGTAFTFTGLDDGDYILTETKAPDGYKLADPIRFTVTADHKSAWKKGEPSPLTALTGDVKTGSIAMEKLTGDAATGALTGSVKNTPPTPPTLEKKIQDINDSTGTRSGWQDSADYDIDDHVPFRLTATLADNVTDYKTYRITFSDTMEQGLTFDGITGVTVGGVPTTSYKLTRNEPHGFDLMLEWKGGNGGRITQNLNGKAVVVTYTATLNSDAVLGKTGNVNKAKLHYSNNPNVEDDGTPGTPDYPDTPDNPSSTPEDAVIAFTYQVSVDKVDEKGAALTGAEFKLEKVLSGGTRKVIATVKSQSGDSFSFKGLDDGNYILTETKTPSGYKAISPIAFTVKGTHLATWDGSEATRTQVLTDLTGDVTSGTLTLAKDAELATLSGDVVNERETGSLKVTKTVSGTNASANTQSFHFTVKLSDKTISGKYGDMTFTKGEASFNLKHGESKTATGLPTNVTYAVTEDKYTGYTTTSTGASGVISAGTTHEAAFTNTPVTTTPTPTATPTPTPRTGGGGGTPGPTPVPRIDIEGTKVWNDQGNAHKVRPGSIELTLLADGVPVDAEPVWVSKSGNNWSYRFENLPQYDEDDDLISYTVQERPVQYYTTAISGMVITNTLEERPPEKYIDLAGQKTWQDNDNAEGKRPTSITVHLLRDGEIISTLNVTAGTDWKYEFKNLPADDGYGHVYTYTIDEETVPGYFKRVDGMNLINGLLPGGSVPNVPDEPEEIPERGGTPAPNFEDLGEEELEDLFDLFGYGTPLYGMLGTGDELPVYPFVFGGIGLLAVALYMALRKRGKA